MLIKLVIFTALLPGLASGAIVLLLSVVPREGRVPWALGAGTVVGYLVGYTGIYGIPPFPPLESVHLLFYLALCAPVVDILKSRLQSHYEVLTEVGPSGSDTIRQKPQGAGPNDRSALGRRCLVKWVVRLALCGFAAWFSLKPLLAYAYGSIGGWTRVAALGAAGTIFWWVIESLSRRASGRVFMRHAMALGVALSMVLLIARSALLAQLQGATDAAIAPALLLALLGFDLSRSIRSIVPGIVLLFLFHGASGFFYANMPGASVLLLSASCIAMAAATAVNNRSIQITLNLSGLLLLPLLAVVVASRASP